MKNFSYTVLPVFMPIPTKFRLSPKDETAVTRAGKRHKTRRHENRMISKPLILSGYQDSNLGPPAPKAGALTGLRYTPNDFSICFSNALQR